MKSLLRFFAFLFVPVGLVSAQTGQIPYPVSAHPRLWVTSADVARLRTWAVSTNTAYTGMQGVLAQAVSVYNTNFFPNGVQNTTWPDPGDSQGYTGDLTEEYAAILAFNSLVDPSAANRIKFAQYARNLIMVALNQAALGHLANAPFRDPSFAIYNRGNGSVYEFPLVVDWIYSAKDASGNAILTAADKATVRKVFLIWANDCLNASTTGGDHPEPIGATNNPQLLPNDLPYRMASNNYYLGHARLLAMMSLCIDPSDDPAVDSTQPLSLLGNSLRSYILDVTGAWLYQEYAMMGEAPTVVSQYGIPGHGTGFGLASGGLPPEGMLYGHSFGFLLGELLALQTAGFNNPSYSGPQIGLIGAPVWSRYVTGFISSLTPAAQVPPTETYLGPVYQFGSYGDLLRLYATQDFFQPLALLTLLEGENGKSNHASAARWFAINAVQGGASGLVSRISDPWTWGAPQSYLYYMLLDPTAPSAPDPRTGYPTVFYDPDAARVVAHSDWTANGTMFDYRASWESINHQDGDGGQFELYRKGEWLTKEMSNYDNNEVGLTTTYHNSLALQNWSAAGTPAISWFEGGEWANGSQWILGDNAGDPRTLMSHGSGYVYLASDLTNLFNRPDVWMPASGAIDITQATRQILWLNNDYIVVYDRGISIHSGLFKRFNLSLVTNPSISGHVSTETVADGQQLFVQTLLPKTPSISSVYAAGNLNPIAELEPTQYVLSVQDPSLPSNTRFLHVLQGADKGVLMVPASYVKSTSGTAFDGAVFGSSAVFFPNVAGAAVRTTVFTVPSTVASVYVAGLGQLTAYGVSVVTSGSSFVITVTAGGTGGTSDAAGLLTVKMP